MSSPTKLLSVNDDKINISFFYFHGPLAKDGYEKG